MSSKQTIFAALFIGISLSTGPCRSANLTGSSLVATAPSCDSATLSDYYACTKRSSATAMAGNSFNMTTDQFSNGILACFKANDCKTPIVKSKTRSITLDDTCDSKALDAKSSVFTTCLQKKNFSVPVVGSLKRQLFEISGFTKSNIINQVKPLCPSEKSQKAAGDCLDQLFLKNGYAQQTKSNRLMKQNYCKLQNQCSSNLSTACKAYLQSVKSAVCACSIQTDYGERKFVNDCLGKKTNNIARNVFGSVYCDFMKACPNSLKKVSVPELIMVDFSKAFQSVPECPTEIETTLTGSLPKWLNGTLLKNGPGVFEVGPDSFRHWFDGFAIFQSFRFTDGKVFYKSKHLRSDSYKDCLKANRIVTSQFGTPASLDPSLNIFRRYSKKLLPPKLTDNDVVNFVQFGDQVWAATETTLMHQIDPVTLDTIKKIDLSKYVAVNVETAHQHYDKRGNVYNIGWSLNTYKIFVTPNSDLFKQTTNLKGFEKTKIMVAIKSKRKRFVSYFHSFAMTENYIIFVEMPLLINTIKLLSAHVRAKSFKDSLTWKHDQKVIFHIVRLSDSTVLKRQYTAEPFFCFHHANAYERQDCLVIDLIAYPNADPIFSLQLENLRKNGLIGNPNNFGTLKRFILPLVVPPNAKSGDDLMNGKPFIGSTAILKADQSISCIGYDLSHGKYTEFPRINYDYNGTPYRYCYACGRSDTHHAFVFNEVYKYDLATDQVKTYKAAYEDDFVGEPVFIAAPNAKTEDDGVLVFPISNVGADESKNRLVVLNAVTFLEMTVARVPKFLALGFHTLYLPKKF